MVRTILVTAFDAFGGEDINPSLEIARNLPNRIGSARIIAAQVPTIFGKAAQTVREYIEQNQPDAVVCLGQAGGRVGISPERVAINLIDAPIADNAGALLSDAPINPHGPAAHFSTLPVKAMVTAIRAKNIPAELSNTAGTFVCNYLMYSVLDYLDAESLDIPAGFIHVPFIPGQNKEPALPLDDMLTGIVAAIETLTTEHSDSSARLGALH